MQEIPFPALLLLLHSEWKWDRVTENVALKRNILSMLATLLGQPVCHKPENCKGGVVVADSIPKRGGGDISEHHLW